MIEVLFEIIPYAVGIAISPVPIITVILSLFSTRAGWNGTAFLLGWALGILVVCIPVLIYTEGAKVTTVADPSRMASVIRVILGSLLLIAAVRRWLKRPKSPEEIKVPKWLMMIEVISPVKVLLVGFFFAVLTNPKNFALTVAGSLPIANSLLPVPMKSVLVTAFILVSSLGIATPVSLYFMAGESAKRILNNWKTWLVANNSAVMAIMFLIFGIIIFSEGMRGLIP
jgi:Sap, sulfolipid-1-addressing protein